MKKSYVTPRADKMEYNYSDKVTASGFGNSYEEFTNVPDGCNDTPTGIWYVGTVRESGCPQRT